MIRPRSPGLSVIVGALEHEMAGVPQSVAALIAQTAAVQDFEVIVVGGGPPDGVRSFRPVATAAGPDLDLRTISVEGANRGQLWNIGLQMSSRRLVTFVRAGDRVGPTFASALLTRSDEWLVGAVPVIGPGRSPSPPDGGYVDPERDPSVLTTVTGRAFAGDVADEVRFSSDLASGLERDFFIRYWMRRRVRVVHAVDPGAAYVRQGDFSLTRALHGFDHAVTDQARTLAALGALLDLVDGADADAATVIGFHQREVAASINRYLHRHPGEHPRVIAAIGEAQARHVPFGAVNAGLARSLVVSVHDPVISGGDGVVDLITRRGTDVGSGLEHLDRRLDIADEGDGGGGVQDWSAIARFVEHGWSVFSRRERDRGPYSRVCSHGPDPAAHVLASLVKARRERISWSVSPGARPDGAPAAPDLALPTGDPIVIELRAAARARGTPIPATPTVGRFVQALVAALADEVVFPSAAERDRAIADYSAPELAERAGRISKASCSPTP